MCFGEKTANGGNLVRHDARYRSIRVRTSRLSTVSVGNVSRMSVVVHGYRPSGESSARAAGAAHDNEPAGALCGVRGEWRPSDVPATILVGCRQSSSRHIAH